MWDLMYSIKVSLTARYQEDIADSGKITIYVDIVWIRVSYAINDENIIIKFRRKRLRCVSPKRVALFLAIDQSCANDTARWILRVSFDKITGDLNFLCIRGNESESNPTLSVYRWRFYILCSKKILLSI